ncbi:DUF3014 domain-containing protein [Spongiibacter sp. KMU-166]|uniref:DUF3014 domain-containing protein n=1 Tax=Spongiibacter thalassae TaxID=2721624 RepID=A0ABX1GFL8_9GAMM|nr:DUF3014 domain-containing protein [Spongiibacter thalassae]NKI17741.1 DUF3014 domain-containing protein [Spongiibacter thalassae]
MNWKMLSAIVAVGVLAGVVWFVVERAGNSPYNDTNLAEATDLDDQPPKKQVKETLAVESEPDYQQEAAKAPEPPKAIDGSDTQLREAAAALSPKLAEWVSPDHQVRKWVALIDQMAAYRLPSKHLPVVFNKEPFLAIKTERGLINDPGNFRRWDPVVNTVTGIEPKKLAIYYKKWSPFLESSYNELGNPQSFDNQLRTTIEHLLIVEPIPADTELKRPKVFYEYADPVLEGADPLSKWLWRLGPENMKKLQAWLKELQSYL